MILLILISRRRDNLDFILVEEVTLISYDLNYCWISLILKIFHSILWFRYPLN